MNRLTWWRVFIRRKPGPPRDRRERERIAEQARREAWGQITDETRAEDRQRLTDAAAGKGSLI